MKTALLAALLDAAEKRDTYRALLASARKAHKKVLEADELVRQLRGLAKPKTSQSSGRAA